MDLQISELMGLKDTGLLRLMKIDNSQNPDRSCLSRNPADQ
jgi:hypothetical protein